MTTSLLRVLQARFQRRNHRQKGFTLIELLIVTIIAGGIVSGLMFLVVELLTADQRDASRNATQQDMQRSLEYISTELRDAVYVYSGDLLSGLVRNNRLPGSLTQASTPVLAFWKQSPLPSNVLAYCSANWRNQRDNGEPPIVDTAGNPIPCAAGHAYSLVVYSLDTDDENNRWSERNARITRYELRPYNNNTGQPTPVPGYVSPIDGPRNLFASWPLDVRGGSRQTARPNGAAPPLTDFVDALPQGTPRCPNDYKISPSNGNNLPLNAYPYSFYACVYTGSPTIGAPPTRTSETESIDNQEVVLYLRGNGFGRPSINSRDGSNSYRPTLTTRVFNRGTLDLNPNID